ncbi:MAG TPA: molecular chaperone DnaK, partial [Polyangiaceae bacterium]|nr:molecular chaperone DnaK [Polyangiaceae bacterium]
KEGREAVEKQDDEKVQSVMASLEKEAHRMASVMYGAAGPGGPGGPGGPPPGGDGGGAAGGGEGGKKEGQVIDAEFEENA